jgi:hypothetical protein
MLQLLYYECSLICHVLSISILDTTDGTDGSSTAVASSSRGDGSKSDGDRGNRGGGNSDPQTKVKCKGTSCSCLFVGVGVILHVIVPIYCGTYCIFVGGVGVILHVIESLADLDVSSVCAYMILMLRRTPVRILRKVKGRPRVHYLKLNHMV